MKASAARMDVTVARTLREAREVQTAKERALVLELIGELGSLKRVCANLGISSQRVRGWRDKDPNFEAEFTAARARGIKRNASRARANAPALLMRPYGEPIDVPRSAKSMYRIQPCLLQGEPVIDLRVWFTTRLGTASPSKRGLPIGAKELPAVIVALKRVLARERSQRNSGA